MAHVKRLLGQPSSKRFSSSGNKVEAVWDYAYSRSNVNPLAFVPLANLAVFACCEWHTVETRTLVVEFSPDEVVRTLTSNTIIE